jgi:hypothetical protein
MAHLHTALIKALKVALQQSFALQALPRLLKLWALRQQRLQRFQALRLQALLAIWSALQTLFALQHSRRRLAQPLPQMLQLWTA